jgi:hypothetical protein
VSGQLVGHDSAGLPIYMYNKNVHPLPQSMYPQDKPATTYLTERGQPYYSSSS